MAGRLVRRTRVTRYAADGSSVGREDSLAVEEPLEVRVNGSSFSVTMRSPGDDFDLVGGFLVSEGVVWSADQLASMRFCAGTDEQGLQTFNVIDASSAPTRPRPT
jgi:FdhD protein